MYPLCITGYEINTESNKINAPYYVRKSATRLIENCVVLHSSASAEHRASVACVVESLRHHRDASAVSSMYSVPGCNRGRNCNLYDLVFMVKTLARGQRLIIILPSTHRIKKVWLGKRLPLGLRALKHKVNSPPPPPTAT